MDDLVTTLNLLDHAELKGSARRLLDQDFLSFLQSIRERRSTGTHSVARRVRWPRPADFPRSVA